jgi:hypothetical protein
VLLYLGLRKDLAARSLARTGRVLGISTGRTGISRSIDVGGIRSATTRCVKWVLGSPRLGG